MGLVQASCSPPLTPCCVGRGQILLKSVKFKQADVSPSPVEVRQALLTVDQLYSAVAQRLAHDMSKKVRDVAAHANNRHQGRGKCRSLLHVGLRPDSWCCWFCGCTGQPKRLCAPPARWHGRCHDAPRLWLGTVPIRDGIWTRHRLLELGSEHHGGHVWVGRLHTMRERGGQ